MIRDEFVKTFGSVYEHSAFIAERAWDNGRIELPLEAPAVREALATEFAAASRDERLGVLRAHPDLAGKLALAGELTAELKSEQASAGLDRLTPAEHARFTELNALYTARFGFPFIIAVKGHDKQSILAAFEQRIAHTPDAEFAVACAEVERIAGFRIDAILPAHDEPAR